MFSKFLGCFFRITYFWYITCFEILTFPQILFISSTPSAKNVIVFSLIICFQLNHVECNSAPFYITYSFISNGLSLTNLIFVGLLVLMSSSMRFMIICFNNSFHSFAVYIQMCFSSKYCSEFQRFHAPF